MQSVLYRIWTRVTVSISYDDYYYTTNLIDTTRKQQVKFNSLVRNHVCERTVRNQQKKKKKGICIEKSRMQSNTETQTEEKCG